MLKTNVWLSMTPTEKQIYVLYQAIKSHWKRKRRPVRQHESNTNLLTVIVSRNNY